MKDGSGKNFSDFRTETDTGAARRLYEIKKQRREHAEALEAQQIQIENTAEAEI